MLVLDHLSLLHGIVPITVDLLAVGLVVVVVVALRRRWWHAAVALGIALVALAWYSYLENLPAQFHGRFPKSFFLWAAAPLAVLIVGTWNWRRITWWPRIAAILAVPLLVVSAAAQVNEFYGYVPTVGDLLGAPLPGQVNNLHQILHMAGWQFRSGFASAAAHEPPSGVLVGINNPAPISHFAHRATFVWLPPAWFARPRVKLPAMMLLEGSPGSPDNWLRVVHTMDVANDWARHHDGNAPIMVMPDSNGGFLRDSECVDGSGGRAETFLTRDVVDWADHYFNISRWATVGLSEGGTCAVDLALRHPQLFPVFADFSGDLYPNLGTETNTIRVLYHHHRAAFLTHDPLRLMATHRYDGMRAWFAAGRSDSKRLPAAVLAAAARRAGMQVELHITSGNHNFYYWRGAFAASYPWLVEGLEPGRAA